MHELFRRLFLHKPLAAEIIVASFFVNILYLASPIFVIQILSRYIGYGFDGTLYTLTMGMLIALVLGMGFSIVRTRMCSAVSEEPDHRLQARVLDGLARTKAAAMERIPAARVQDVLAGPQIVQSAYEASRIASVLDMPFFILFVLAIFVLSPTLAVITLLAVVSTVGAGKLNMDRAKKLDNAMREESLRHRSSVNSAITGTETVRAFRGGEHLHRIWDEQVHRLSEVRERVVNQRSWSLAIVSVLNSLLKVAIYAVGAKLVVSGDLSVGSLIGASILSAKALQISSSFMQSVLQMGKADEALRMINEFSSLPRESGGGKAMKAYSGRLELHDVAMAFPGATGPLFESLSAVIEPGSVVGVLGANGTGKTTLAKLVVGLLDPGRGQILADGVDLRQLAADWWRTQVVYLPQEPMFLNGTYRENITLLNPDVDDAKLNEIVRLADLRRFLDGTPTGIDTVIADGGRSLPMGIRKRLALARALMGEGRIAVFDEPTEGLDVEGCEAIFQVMNLLVQRGTTIVAVSRDPNVVKGYGMVIDLNSKPVPKVGRVQKKKPAPEAGTTLTS
ncbi:ABC transporter transmembrane domain-containing protein [Pseudodesulfovibrio sp.]|uniref:peptidase domain-containing ABC transporter n=1 Tax=Pseudodesulfovibrio sp. TaxID=2035812 RepID=UPI00262118B0|nr:ABC transporter transmembrane domain-containing protein [Pseudodesulfovibrio sp.]MDD3313715.1 ATP-binding cassette domain-containing protein [Pseudodesulfovibrio sp.]